MFPIGECHHNHKCYDITPQHQDISFGQYYRDECLSRLIYGPHVTRKTIELVIIKIDGLLVTPPQTDTPSASDITHTVSVRWRSRYIITFKLNDYRMQSI